MYTNLYKKRIKLLDKTAMTLTLLSQFILVYFYSLYKSARFEFFKTLKVSLISKYSYALMNKSLVNNIYYYNYIWTMSLKLYRLAAYKFNF